MKRMMALALALMALLTWTVGFAETSGTRFRLTKMQITRLSGEGEPVNLHDMKLYVSMGSAEGVPTLQLVLSYGEEQQLDGVVQVVGSRILICVGGISGTYYVDLGDLFDEPGKGMLMATAFGAGLKMIGENPDLLDQLMQPEKNGKYNSVRFELPMETVTALLGRLTGEVGDEAQAPELQSALDGFMQNNAPVAVTIRYRQDKKWAKFYFTAGDESIRLNARMKQTTGAIELLNISQDEEQYNLLDLDQDKKDELIGELEFLGIKIGSFLRHSSLHRLTDEPEE